MSKWQKKKRNKVFENKWVKVQVDDVIRPDGKNGQYTVVETDSVVTVAAFSKDKEIYLVKLFRYPIQKDSWEIVKGRADGEEPILAAIRELREETGFVAEKWHDLGTFFPLNGLSDEKNTVFIAEELKQTGIDKMREEGIAEVKKYSWKKIEEMIESGKITDGQTIASLYKVKLSLEKK